MVRRKNNVLWIIFSALFVLFFESCKNNNEHTATENVIGKTPSTLSIPWRELNLAKDSAALLISARSLMVADTNVAFITVDSLGRPRVRTVYTIIEEELENTISKDTRIWIMTRYSTRKVSQLRADPRVTLYYNDDEAVQYASIMGIATLYTDPNNSDVAQFLSTKVDKGMIQYFWPSFPSDFALIKIRPQWIEYLSKENAHADSKTWRPQAVVFAE